MNNPVPEIEINMIKIGAWPRFTMGDSLQPDAAGARNYSQTRGSEPRSRQNIIGVAHDPSGHNEK